MIKAEKARELFSAYWEGSLDPSLKQQMDRSFGSHPDLMEEYRDFVRAMEILEVSAEYDVPVPHDLHARISARLDQAMTEKESKPAFGWTTKWRQFALLGGFCVVAIGAIFAFQGNVATTEANVIGGSRPVQKPAQELKFAVVKGEVMLEIQSSQADVFKVMKLSDGSDVRSIDVSAKGSNSTPLRNTGELPVTLRIDSQVSKTSVIVVLPGTRKVEVAEGSGNVIQLAEAMAGFYQRAIQVDVKDRSKLVRWTLDPQSVTSPKLSESGISVVDGDILRLLD